MSAKRDYYELLGVSRGADAVTLKKAFRGEAVKYHPDRNSAPGAEDRFKEVNEAYAVLSDPDQRRNYDRFGHNAPSAGPGRSPFDGGFGASPADLKDIFGGDLFEELFGAFMGRRSSARHGQDIHIDLSVTLDEVAAGAEKALEFERDTECGRCAGSGARPGTAPSKCTICGGQGQVRVARGFISMVQACPHCSGRGKVVEDPCPTCRGRGLKKAAIKVPLPVPAGVKTGHKLRLDGEGEPGTAGAQAGDLYVHIKVASHPFFERDGLNVVCEVPISFVQAALGTTVEVPTLNGRARVKVPAGTQSGKLLRLRGKGLPAVHGNKHGDQLVRLQIETPRKLTTHQKELLRAFEAENPGGGEVADPQQQSFMEKLKGWFE